MKQVEKKYNYIDALSFMPGLDIEVKNFEIWLEDAWNIVIFDNVVKDRALEENKDLTYKECGDILIWIVSFYGVYSDFDNILAEESKEHKNYKKFFEFLDEWQVFLSNYLEQKIYERVNNHILNKELSCEFPLYDLELKCFNFDCKEQRNCSLPYEVLMEEILIKKKFIKRKLYNYFYMESKKYNFEITTNEMLMQFMFSFHWLVNYTDFDDEYFVKIVNSDNNSEEYMKQYYKELLEETYMSFNKLYKPSIESNFNFSFLKYLNPLILKSSILMVKWHDDNYSFWDEEYTDIIDLIHSSDEKIWLADNWLSSWRSLK